MRPDTVLFKFAGWLSSREEKVTFSSKHDCGNIAKLVDEFCKDNQLYPHDYGAELDLGVNTQPVKDASVLPLIISENGEEGEQILEAIYCEKISKEYKYQMPKSLILVRNIHNGEVYRKEYKQQR